MSPPAAPAAPYPGYYPPPGWWSPPPYYYQGQALLPPPTLPYDEGQSVPHGYRVRTRPRRPLIVAGSITFGTTYLASVLGAATVLAGGISDGKPYAPLFAPVVGPFITLGTASSGAGTPFLVLDGLAQLGGMVMLICGAVIEEKYLQRAPTDASALDVLLHPDVIAGPRAVALRWTL